VAEKSQILAVRLPPGSLQRIDGVLRENEDRASFLRALVAAELDRREVEAKRTARIVDVAGMIA
jgi:hypothetical protein